MMAAFAEKKKPALEGFFTWPSDHPSLIASRCKSCATYSFPKKSMCPNPTCKDKEMEEVLLSRRGKLWSFTVHYYQVPPPFKGPDPFVPFGIGVIELPEGLKVLSMLTTSDPTALKIGMEMELLIDRIYEDQRGTEYLTWKFTPL